MEKMYKAWTILSPDDEPRIAKTKATEYELDGSGFMDFCGLQVFRTFNEARDAYVELMEQDLVYAQEKVDEGKLFTQKNIRMREWDRKSSSGRKL